jgi:predicted nucleic acid-binding protein
MKKVLIDTDVLIDFLGGRQPFVMDAEKIFSLCEMGKIKAYVTPVIISNAYYILRKKHGDKKTRKKIVGLMDMVDVLTINKKAVVQALHSSFRDFEDSLQNEAAEAFKVEVILTRNTKDYKKSKLAVMEPKDFLKTL